MDLECIQYIICTQCQKNLWLSFSSDYDILNVSIQTKYIILQIKVHDYLEMAYIWKKSVVFKLWDNPSLRVSNMELCLELKVCRT